MKESIGDGQTKTPVPLRLRTSKAQIALTKAFKKFNGLEPSDLFSETVEDLKVYAKNPRRIKTKLKPVISHGRARSLSFEEIAATERRMILDGENINPIFCKKEAKMSNDVESRRERLYDVMKRYIKARKYFKATMLKGENLLDDKNRRYITDDPKYFERNIRDDLNCLKKRNLIYSRGRPPSWYLGSDEEFHEEEEQKQSSTPEALTVPEHITVDINVNVTFS